MEKLRKKCWMIERTKKEFDNLPTIQVQEMCGFYWPEGEIEWEVNREWVGEGYTAKTQFEAEMISHAAMMRWLYLKKLKKNGGS
jgi:hypothetical protein